MRGSAKGKVLVFADHYLPGFKGGGPIASISRIVEADATREYRILTRDRDLGDQLPYPRAQPRAWLGMPGCSVAYLRPGFRDVAWVLRCIKTWRPDSHYFNSLFSLHATLLPLVGIRLQVLPRAEVFIAPRGELASGAIAIKSRKKRFWAPFVKWAVGTTVTWHVSSLQEEEQVRSWWGSPLPARHRFVVAINAAPPPETMPSSGPTKGLVVVYASRIDRKKGLDRAIELVGTVGAARDVEFRIAGAVSDEKYWEECRAMLADLPDRVTVRIDGAYSPSQTREMFGQASVFLFPTRGENFGHAIAEALAVGCLVVVPDNTPWTELVALGGGHVIRDESGTVDFLLRMSDLGKPEVEQLRAQALHLYADWFMRHRGQSNPFDAVAAGEGPSL